MLCSVIEHGMTSYYFQTSQKNSASLRSSVWQFTNSMMSYHLYNRTKHAFLCFNCLPSSVYCRCRCSISVMMLITFRHIFIIREDVYYPDRYLHYSEVSLSRTDSTKIMIKDTMALPRNQLDHCHQVKSITVGSIDNDALH